MAACQVVVRLSPAHLLTGGRDRLLVVAHQARALVLLLDRAALVLGGASNLLVVVREDLVISETALLLHGFFLCLFGLSHVGFE